MAKDSRAVFLDEPLANLDYKLREELRDQLPDLFAGRGAVVVYATSEPEEALLLGGTTALMSDGHVAEFGATAEIYRHPSNLTSAAVFSDPPINQAPVTKRGDLIRLSDGISWHPEGAATRLRDGEYTVAIRPDNVLPLRTESAHVPISGTVLVTELSGSDSSAHFSMGDENWVSLASGVHVFHIGEEREFYMDPTKCFYFGPDGSLAA